MEQIRFFLQKNNPGYYLYPVTEMELEKDCIFRDIDFNKKKIYICNANLDNELKKQIVKLRLGLHDIYKKYQKMYEKSGDENDLAVEFIIRMISAYLFHPNGMDKKHKIYMSTLVERLIFHNNYFNLNTQNSLEYSKNYRYITLGSNLENVMNHYLNSEKYWYYSEKMIVLKQYSA